MATAARLLNRAHLRAYLADLPWATVLERIEGGKLPRPLWKLAPTDKDARWDRLAVDRALDAESAIPATIERQERELDRALGFR